MAITNSLITSLATILSDRSNKELVRTYLFSKPSDYDLESLKVVATKLITEAKRLSKTSITLTDQYCGGAFFVLALAKAIQDQKFPVSVNLFDKIYSKKNNEYEFIPFTANKKFVTEIESVLLAICAQAPEVKFHVPITLSSASLNVLVFDPTVRGNKTSGADEHLEKLSFYDASKITLQGKPAFVGDKDNTLNSQVIQYDFLLTLKQNSKYFKDSMTSITLDENKKPKINSLRKVIYLQVESENLHATCIDEQSLNKVQFFSPDKYDALSEKVAIKGDSNQIQLFNYVDQAVVDMSEVKPQYFKVNIADNNKLLEILAPNDLANSRESKLILEAFEEYLQSIKEQIPEVSLDNYIEKLYQLKSEI